MNVNYEKTIREATVHHSINGEFSIRQGNWKLLLSPSSGGWSFPRPNDKKALENLPKVQLYNTALDASEIHNVEAEHPEIVKKLKDLLLKYIREGRSTPGTPQPNDNGSEWKQVKDIIELQ